jgi:F-type H+-transporting ATPase subunit beta
VVDVYFPDALPKVYDALLVKRKNVHKEEVVIEVLQILEDNIVRGIAMASIDGLRRGDEVKNTGNPISVPVGNEVLGRIFNALGEPLDTQITQTTSEKIVAKNRSPIHRPAPAFSELSTRQEILETGIKVIDLLAPILKGGKV